MVSPKLRNYVNKNIIPKYHSMQDGHDDVHINNVLKDAFRIANNPKLRKYTINHDILFTAVVYHDIGMIHGRKDHEIKSVEILNSDQFIKNFFSKKDLQVISDAIEDHRSSRFGMRRSIYGKILSDADNESAMDPTRSITRLWKYREVNMADFSNEEKFASMMSYINELYSDKGLYKSFELPIDCNINTIKHAGELMKNPEYTKKILEKEFGVKV